MRRLSVSLVAFATAVSVIASTSVMAQAKTTQTKQTVEKTAVAKSQDVPWTLFRGDAACSGVAQTTLPLELATVWQQKIPKASFESTPIIINPAGQPAMVVIGDVDGHLYALRLSDGEVLWKHKAEIGYITAAAWRDDRIFIGDFDGFFHCIDLSGKELWKYETEAEIDSSANFYKDLVLVAAQDGALYALNRETGKLAWKHQTGDQLQCSIAVIENRAFLAGCDGKLHIVNLDDGKQAAAVEIDGPTGTTPAAFGNHVFFGTQQGNFFAIDWREAKVAWQREDPLGGTTIVASAAVNDQRVVFGTRNRQLISLDRKTGAEQWVTKLRAKIDSSPVIVGDRVFAATTDGRIYWLSLEDGSIAWESQLNGAIIGSPAVAMERLVIATDRGVVYCLGATQK